MEQLSIYNVETNCIEGVISDETLASEYSFYNKNPLDLEGEELDDC